MRQQLAVILTCILCISCEISDCPINNIVYSTYGFYGNIEGSVQKINVLDTLTVRASGTDSILINRIRNVSDITLPLSYVAQEDTLIFQFTNELRVVREDSVFIRKENIRHYESPDCPASMFHIIQEVRHTNVLIDSIAIINPNINYNASENFKIIFHTDY